MNKKALIILMIIFVFISSCGEKVDDKSWVGTYEGKTGGSESKGVIILREDNTYQMIIENKMNISGKIIHNDDGTMELPYEEYEDNLLIKVDGDKLIIDDTGIELERKK